MPPHTSRVHGRAAKANGRAGEVVQEVRRGLRPVVCSALPSGPANLWDLRVGMLVQNESTKFIQGLNPVRLFVEERCLIDVHAAVPTADLYEEYTQWCHEGGQRAMAKQRFYNQLLMHFPVDKRQHGPKRRPHIIGLELQDNQGRF